MAGKQIGGEGGVPENLAGMTKSQLYDIMSQMKVVFSLFSTRRLSATTLSRILFCDWLNLMTQTLIDQNHEQAREILIRNPLLTKALFQVSFLLDWTGLVKLLRLKKLGFVILWHEECVDNYVTCCIWCYMLVNVRHRSCLEWFSLLRWYLLESLQRKTCLSHSFSCHLPLTTLFI